ncbi:MAG: histidine kinase [Coriobacteriales bacterium]|nr:histidine kinase [Coriobacteriales bacterium]
MKTNRIIIAIILVGCCIALSTIAIIALFSLSPESTAIVIFCIVALVAISIITIRKFSVSKEVMASQSNRTLELASQTVTFMREGLSESSAQAVCELLLPESLAVAVSITDEEKILGFAGKERKHHVPGTVIQSNVTNETIKTGKTHVAYSPQDIGFPEGNKYLQQAIVAPLVVRQQIIGTIKFYYTKKTLIDEQQTAIASGFAMLLSTQLSLYYLGQQEELATKMQLVALQSQINPHFLFNTINTIASITRNNPDKAREMLREFAVYYRSLLENSQDLIPISREVEQTQRYLMFQKARFGEDSVEMSLDIDPNFADLYVPAFIIQPLVENAVGHGRREDQTLHIKVKIYESQKNVMICVEDDGKGIPKTQVAGIVVGGSKTGMGIALKNVDARLKGYFGALSGIKIDSVFGKGTSVYLTLYGASDEV